jgi:nicotinamidase/pyrazinamidase
MGTALIIVDVQRDFISGSLGAPGRARVIEPLTRLVNTADLVVSSLDWHLANHFSFAERPTFTDGSWPVHCVRDTRGAELHPALAWLSNEFVYKGTAQDIEAYSAFEGMTERSDSLGAVLTQHGIDQVVIGGLCTDYCVLATALDAIRLGYYVTVAVDACAGVSGPTTAEALSRMEGAGITLARTLK